MVASEFREATKKQWLAQNGSLNRADAGSNPVDAIYRGFAKW